MIKYGQADLMIYLMNRATQKLAEKKIITEEQKKRLDEHNEEIVMREYPSAFDYELSG